MANRPTLTNNPITAAVGKAIDALPLATRIIATVYVITLLPTIMPLEWMNDSIVDASAMCAASLQSSPSPLIQLYRFLLAPFIHVDFISGAVALFAFIQVGHRIEQQKGTIALIQLFGLVLLLTQAAHLFIVSYSMTLPWIVNLARENYINLEAASYFDNLRIPIWGAHPRDLIGQSAYTWRSLFSFSIPTQACSVNPWPILFAIIVYECQSLTNDFSRYVFLIPTLVPTRLIPLLFFAFFQFWFGVQLATFIGFAVGYLLCAMPFLLLPPWILRSAEIGLCKQYDSFVSVERAGKMQPYRQYVQQESATVSTTPAPIVTQVNSINAPVNISRSSVPVNRGVRTPSDQWRRLDVASSASSSSSSSSSPSDGEEVSAGHHSSAVVKSLSPKRSSSTSPRVDHPAGSEVSNDQTAVLAANVARILEPQYPLGPPTQDDIRNLKAKDDALVREHEG